MTDSLRRVEIDYHAKAIEILGHDIERGSYEPDEEKVMAHAREILPHLGPDTTAAYISSAVSGEHGQHEVLGGKQ